MYGYFYVHVSGQRRAGLERYEAVPEALEL